MNPVHGRPWLLIVALVGAVGSPAVVLADDQPPKVTVRWDKVTRVSKTTPTLQVVVNPPLRRGTTVHDGAFKALKDIQADYVRYVPWLPYPRLGVDGAPGVQAACCQGHTEDDETRRGHAAAAG